MCCQINIGIWFIVYLTVQNSSANKPPNVNFGYYFRHVLLFIQAAYFVICFLLFPGKMLFVWGRLTRKICEILVMLPFVTHLTSDVYNYLKILHPDESPPKMMLFGWWLPDFLCLNTVCQNVEQKHKTLGKRLRCWSQLLAEPLLLQTAVLLKLPEKQTNVFMSGAEGGGMHAVLTVYLPGSLKEEAGFKSLQY